MHFRQNKIKGLAIIRLIPCFIDGGLVGTWSTHGQHLPRNTHIEGLPKKKGALLFGKRAPNIFHVSQFGNGHMSRADSFAFPVLLLLDMEPLRGGGGHGT